eukprot:10126708-Karenia_brevis.AAC.1
MHFSKTKLKYSLPQFGTSGPNTACNSGPSLSRTTSLNNLHSSASSTHSPPPAVEYPVNNRLRMSRARRFKLAALGVDIGSGPLFYSSCRTDLIQSG